MKLLIVEDESSLRELLARALRKEQYVVETASTYAEASDKLAAYSYDCILLDIMLPDGNGLQLLERLRRADKRENVIIISARDSLEDKVLGPKEYRTPFSIKRPPCRLFPLGNFPGRALHYPAQCRLSRHRDYGE